MLFHNLFRKQIDFRRSINGSCGGGASAAAKTSEPGRSGVRRKRKMRWRLRRRECARQDQPTGVIWQGKLGKTGNSKEGGHAKAQAMVAHFRFLGGGVGLVDSARENYKARAVVEIYRILLNRGQYHVLDVT